MGLMPRAESRTGFLAGLGVIVLLWAAGLLAAHEGRLAHWRADGTLGSGKVVALASANVPGAGLEGRTVLVTGTPQVKVVPRDGDFRIQADSPVLVRRVQMFQWLEDRSAATPRYTRGWADHAVDSTRFVHPAGHANTQPFPFRGKRYTAPEVWLGAYRLAPAIVRALPGALRPLPPRLSRLPPNLQASFRRQGPYLTTAADAGAPLLGDIRVQWLERPLLPVTVLAQVHGHTLVARTKVPHGPGFQVRAGKQSLSAVLATRHLPAWALWKWRVLALVLALAGATLAFHTWQRPWPRVALIVGSSTGLLAVVVLVVHLI